MELSVLEPQVPCDTVGREQVLGGEPAVLLSAASSLRHSLLTCDMKPPSPHSRATWRTQ